MKVVASYLPGLAHVDRDLDRVARAVRFTTADGQRFDSFALDIESTVVDRESARNRALDTLSGKIRGLVGPAYPLGAIIPSPVTIAKKAGYWDTFPYRSVARAYDVLVPMGYYTLDGDGAAATSVNARRNVRILSRIDAVPLLPVEVPQVEHDRVVRGVLTVAGPVEIVIAQQPGSPTAGRFARGDSTGPGIQDLVV